jgi:hypothetical protein
MMDTAENTPHLIAIRLSCDSSDRLIPFPPAFVCAGAAIPATAHPLDPQISSADRSVERHSYGCENRDDLDSTLQRAF